MEKPVVCLCVDENICMYTDHVYNSILKNTGEVLFYIICDISVPNEVIQNYEKKGYKVIPNIDIPEIDTSKLKAGSIKSKAMYYRWLLPDLLPYDKVIYLDNDVIIEGNLYELWNIDLKDNYVAAVPDPFYSTLREMWMYQTNIPLDEAYLDIASMCSGQLIINSKLWREDNLKDKLIEFANKFNALDMIPLDILCAGKIHVLPKEWSTPANYYSYPSPKLWHWHGKKPWNRICLHQEIYEKYLFNN